MIELVVISGKGGTGKTTVVGALAPLVSNKLIADCDVDASNLHLLLGGNVQHCTPYEGVEVASIDPSSCTGCGACMHACRFNAITSHDGAFVVDPLSCEGCGVCAHVCVPGAAELNPRLSGHVYISSTPYGTMVHGELRPGEEATGKLVAQVKQQARARASVEKRTVLLVDGSPGIGCPVIASLSGATAALVITEPSLSALHDLERAVDLAQTFGATVFVAMNKADLERTMARKVHRWVVAHRLPVVGWIPYDEAVQGALVAGQPLTVYTRGPAARAIRGLWKRLECALLGVQEHRA